MSIIIIFKEDNMSVDLSKGERVSLEKEAPGVTSFGVGLGWDIKEDDTGSDFDLDASVFAINSSGKVPKKEYFVYFNNLKSPEGAIEHMGDNLTGKGEGDDEVIYI